MRSAVFSVQDNAEIWRYLPSDKHKKTRVFPIPDIAIQNSTRSVDIRVDIGYLRNKYGKDTY